MSENVVVKALGLDDDNVATKLLDKNFSPLIVRKYQLKENWPIWVALICDCSLSDLDKIVLDAMDVCRQKGMMINDIQSLRNVCGYLNQTLIDHYDSVKRGSVEGVAVLAYFDKIFISALALDFMTHLSCKLELYQIINTLPHI